MNCIRRASVHKINNNFVVRQLRVDEEENFAISSSITSSRNSPENQVI